MSPKTNCAAVKLIALKPSQVLELLVLTGLAILLALYLLSRSAAGFSYELPQFDEVADIQSIRWSRNDGNEYNLRRDGGQWYIDKYPAKKSNVETLLKQLESPSLQDLVSKSGNLLTYGLKNAYKLEAFGSDAKVLRQLYIGKSSSSGRYSFVRLNEDDARIFTLSENLTAILQKSLDDLRDRLVLQFSSSDIESLNIRATATDKIISTKKQDDKWQIPAESIWNEEKVKSLVDRFSSINAKSFLMEYPQSTAEYELKFTAKGGASYIVNISAQPLGEDLVKDQGYAAKSSSYGFPFTLDNYIVENMLENFGFVATKTE